jgi:hypothetical protein
VVFLKKTVILKPFSVKEFVKNGREKNPSDR